MNSRPSFSLKLLGSPSILDSSGAPLGGQAAQRHRIALLALLARSPERGVSREKLLAYLWPESGPEQARNLLNVSVYVLRKALGEDAFLSSVDPLRLNPELIRADVAELDAALQQGEYERAIASYEGPFLDGFFLGSAPELERWVDRERDRLAGLYAKALDELAAAAEARGDPDTAVAWWKRRAAHDPYDSRVARRLMQMYDAAGNPAAALQHATIHERLLQDEFGVRPDRETRVVVEAIRRRQDSAEPYDETRHPGPRQLDAPRPGEPGEQGPPEEPRREGATASVAASGLEKVNTTDAAAGPAGWIPPRATPRIGRRMILGVGGAAALLAFWGLVVLLPSVASRSRAGLAAAPRDAPGAPDDGVASASRREAAARSIAVLPFVNLNPDPAEEYFSDGLAEDLIGALARIGALRVAARTSSFAFKGKTGDVRAIGDTLNVATVLEGSVRRSGDRLLVTVQLIDVEDGFHLWSETYERRFTEIFDLQRDLALQIAAALEAELTPGERVRLAARPTEQLEAYTSYLKGRYFWNQRTPSSYARAIEYFQHATQLDPQYAEPHAGLAGVYSLQGLAGAVGAESARQLARTAALRAIELDSGNAEAHAVLGLYLHAYEWDATAAEREFRQSIALDPSHTQARHWYGNLLGATGRLDEAVEQKQRAVELDPLVPALSETLAFTLIRAGRLDEAKRHVRNALELDSTYWRAHAVAGLIHEQLLQVDSAVRAYERANEHARASIHRTKADIARILARSGRRDEARRLVDELRDEADSTGGYDPAVATVLLALGDTDASFAWLEHALQLRHPHLPFIPGDARFAGFDREPRFADLIHRVGMSRMKPAETR